MSGSHQDVDGAAHAELRALIMGDGAVSQQLLQQTT